MNREPMNKLRAILLAALLLAPLTANAAPPKAEPCMINVLAPNNSVLRFPPDIARAVAVQAMIRDGFFTSESAAEQAFDTAVADEKRTCAPWKRWFH